MDLQFGISEGAILLNVIAWVYNAGVWNQRLKSLEGLPRQLNSIAREVHKNTTKLSAVEAKCKATHGT